MASVLGSVQHRPSTTGIVKKYNDLTLKLKYEVIKAVEKELRIGIRKLASMFSCVKTQISMILKNKERIVELYEKVPNAQKDSWVHVFRGQ